MATNLENKINRVATNVTDALAAIAAKGVDITGMNSDNLAALIGLISGTEDLTAELEAQDAIITELEEAVANKAAGSGEPPNIQPLTVTENGTYTVSGDVDGYSPITVNVPSSGGGIVPSGTKQITENGTYDVTNYASAEVNVPKKEPVLEPLSVTANGTYTPPGDVDGYSKVVVNVPPSGSSGDIETCTLTVNHGTSAEYGNLITLLIYNKAENGSVVGVCNENVNVGSFDVTCVKGSCVVFILTDLTNVNTTCSGDAVVLNNWFPQCTVQVNGNATVTISEE